MNLCKVICGYSDQEVKEEEILKARGKKKQIKSNGERKVVLIGICLGGAGTGDGGEVSLQVILLCNKHFNSLDKYDVDHPWILPYLHIYIQSASTSISSSIKASSESCSMATAGPTALASLVS